MTSYSRNDRLSRMLTVNEVAHLLNIHPGTVRRWEKNGHLKSCRIGPKGSIRFRREDVLKFVSTNSNKSAA
jgi:excisionase family DNA binding protein